MSKKDLFFNIDFVHVWKCILGAFGTPLGLSWDALGAKMAPRSDAIIGGEQLFFRFDEFCDPLSDFHQFGEVWGGIWEGLGGVLGRFLEDLAQIFGKFGKRITCVGEWLITSI